MKEVRIRRLIAREILDSRGNPTIEVDCFLDDGSMGKAAVPSGASTGSREALELRDGESRYLGKGVRKAVENVNKVFALSLSGKIPFDQAEIDRLLCEIDGTPNKSRYGANAILGVSLAVMKASACSLSIPLYRYIGGFNARIIPVPFMNVINGGVHADNPLDIQEFMIVPAGAPNFTEALRYGAETFHSLKKILKSKGQITSVGDEGGFAPQVNTSEEVLEIMLEAVEKAGYRPGKDLFFALDSAASEFFRDGLYHFEGKALKSSEMISIYERLISKYPVISIEDPLAEGDQEGWKKLTESLGNKVQIVGDDVFVTNAEILKKGIKEGIANSVLIKLNQVGTVTETMDTINIALRAGYTTMVSHRSGETEDTTIADFAVGIGAGMIKTGSVSRSERIAKYNRLLEIEEELGNNAVFLGLDAVKNFGKCG
ncbi:MAG TPA: phosphopyruvate hydratase [Candidatus Hydrothermia bacterium]|nr:phosphopyruvate hydratase [Candidatus Hydrothermia bacterium]HRD22606.1 phosphopyruvate hydratase [Candidatus Hydrothermia bacterium]